MLPSVFRYRLRAGGKPKYPRTAFPIHSCVAEFLPVLMLADNEDRTAVQRGICGRRIFLWPQRYWKRGAAALNPRGERIAHQQPSGKTDHARFHGYASPWCADRRARQFISNVTASSLPAAG
ncbi:hypothetical protein KIF59_23760 [Enterobacter cloacae subsp. cloacae]|nr:hypothetical protein [Enterobacter cloacae subsp. cloacae]